MAFAALLCGQGEVREEHKEAEKNLQAAFDDLHAFVGSLADVLDKVIGFGVPLTQSRGGRERERDRERQRETERERKREREEERDSVCVCVFCVFVCLCVCVCVCVCARL